MGGYYNRAGGCITTVVGGREGGETWGEGLVVHFRDLQQWLGWAFTLKPPGGSGNQCTPIWHTHGGLFNLARGRDTLCRPLECVTQGGALVGV